MNISGKTVIVTGAGSGVGRALALAFGRQGMNVICAARRVDRLDETVATIASAGGSGLAVQTDVTSRESCETLVHRTLQRFGAIDVLFNNAGSFAALGSVWEVDPETWWQDVTVNLRGPMLCSRAVLPHMASRGEGLIINMSGGNMIPGGTGYSTSKCAVDRLTVLLAKELERKAPGVICVGMGPGFVLTEMTQVQVDSPEGKYWLPSSGEAVAQGRCRPPEACAEKTLELLRKLHPKMNGRLFGVGTDFDAVLAEIAAGR